MKFINAMFEERKEPPVDMLAMMASMGLGDKYDWTMRGGAIHYDL